MRYRRLGKSGLQVSEFSLGSWVTFGKQVDTGDAKALMTAAYDAGVNFFDNAEGYEAGNSEIVMGEALKALGWTRDTYIVSSKVFWGGSRPTQRGLSRKHVTDACHAALKRCRWIIWTSISATGPTSITPIEENGPAMHDLIQQARCSTGALRSGTRSRSPRRIAWRGNGCSRPPTMEQPQYHNFERAKVEGDYAPLYDTVGLGTTIWSPLASGFSRASTTTGCLRTAAQCCRV